MKKQEMHKLKIKISELLQSLNGGKGTLVINATLIEIDKSMCWDWENWQGDLKGFYTGKKKPIQPTESFIDDWLDYNLYKRFDYETLKNNI